MTATQMIELMNRKPFDAFEVHLADGANIKVEELVPNSQSEHPLARFAGCMKDDPLYDKWQIAVAEYRASCDQHGA